MLFDKFTLYLMFFRLMFDSRFDSQPTVSSTTYSNKLFEDVNNKSGGNLSPMIVEVVLNPGRSAKSYNRLQTVVFAQGS